MFTEDDGTTINSEDRKEFLVRKMLKFTQFCNFEKALGKISILEITAQESEAGVFLTFS